VSIVSVENAESADKKTAFSVRERRGVLDFRGAGDGNTLR